MHCHNCGTLLEENDKFCANCGERVMTAPPAPAEKPKKSRKGLWIALIILILLIGLGVAAVLFFMPMFPAHCQVIAPENLATTNGTFDELTFRVQTNQPITDIRYAVDPADPADTAAFSSADYAENGDETFATVRDAQVQLGTTPLYIYVKTWFEEYVFSWDLRYDVGYYTTHEGEDVTVIGDGLAIVSNELEICFVDGTTAETAEEIIASYGGEIIGQVFFLNQYQVRFHVSAELPLEELVAQLESEPEVELVCYNLVSDFERLSFSNDTEYDDWNVEKPGGNNWWLECINAPGAWDHIADMSAVKIGVIDTAIDYDHPDLQVDPSRTHALATNDFLTVPDLVAYYDQHKESHTCPPDGCDFCSLSHGVHVSGIIGAIHNNHLGVSGVHPNVQLEFAQGWHSTEIAPGQIVSESSYEALQFQIIKLATSGCRVINMSLGETEVSSETDAERRTTAKFDRTIRKLAEHGYDFIITKAAGNENADAADFCLNRVLTGGTHTLAHTLIVGALEYPMEHHDAFWEDETQYAMARYSNFGDMVEIVAPGSSILSTVFDGYDTYSGTSMAAPATAGVAGLLYSVNPSLNHNEVKSILRSQTEQYTAKNGAVYPIVDACASVEYVLENGGGTPELKLPSAGYITGLIQDAVTEDLIPHAAVFVTNTETGERMAATVENGTYYIYVEAGVYDLEFYADAYLTETVYNVVVQEGVVSYNVLLNMVEDTEEAGEVTGSIIDAFDASKIPNASIRVFEGINRTDGEPIATLTSDRNGSYRLTLAPGNYTLRAGANGYTDGSANILVLPGETTTNQNCTLTPVLRNGEFRAVLTWGQYPLDLDSHLVGPTPDGGTFHTFWPSTERDYYHNGTQYVNLDVDDRYSYGPETTSVYVPVDGTYTFYVHDYSNCVDSYSSELANSGAQVTVYIAGKETPYVFNVPPYDGTLWEVFSIRNGELIAGNVMSYHVTSSEIGK